MKRAILAFLCIAIAAMATAHAGTTGVLHGYARTYGGKPIAGAYIRAMSASWAASTRTDAHGFFVFLDLPPDTYTISAEKMGYVPSSYAGARVDSDQAIFAVVSMVTWGCGGRFLATNASGLSFISLNVKALSGYPPSFPSLRLPLFSQHRPYVLRCL